MGVLSDELGQDNDPLLGRVIDGRFTIQSVLGRGGMGVVYRAHQASLERSVALKLMTGVPPDRAEEFQRRFFLEAATAARLKHPNTITVFDYGSSVIEGETVFYITMELLEGQTLSRLLTKSKVLPPLRAVHIALQIARSLREAHKEGVVHRDLKPGNVMIVRQDDSDDVEGDFVKVLDFGLAKTRGPEGSTTEGLTRAGTFMGSPRYVAPEQVEGRAVDGRADIYSFGCVLYRMLSGRVPFDGQQAVEIMLKHLQQRVPPLRVPGLPRSLEALVMDCLAKKPGHRPSDMDEVAERLREARAELLGSVSGANHHPDARPAADAIFDDDMPPASPSELPSPPSSELGATRVVVAPGLPTGAAFSGVPSPADLVLPSSEPHVLGELALSRPMSNDDSTRPTRLLGQIRSSPTPRRPWAALGTGVVIGLVLCGVGAAWRLGALEPMWASLRRSEERAALPHAAPVPLGPFARHARVRIKTEPSGADVLEVVNGLPRLLGVTPLVLDWDVEAEPHPRELTLRKEGYAPSRALLQPPAPAEHEPVWIDVAAALRSSKPGP